MALTKVSYAMINGTPINVLDYGATGNGSTDDTAAIQAALDTGANSVYFPAGTYKISSTLTPANNQTLWGVSREWGPGGTIFSATSGLNVPMVKFTSGGTIHNISLSGTATSSTTSQVLIYINNTNGVTVNNCFLNGGYSLIKIDGESFYITLQNNVFYSAYDTQLFVTSVAANGVDLIMDNCRFLSLPSTASAAMSFYGLGSIICSNTQVSVQSVKAGGAQIFFDLPAANYGGAQFVNCVFENASASSSTYAVYAKGTSGSPWTYLMFNNCIFGGGNGIALRADYTTLMEVIGGSMSSVNASGAFYTPTSGNNNTFSFVGVDFEGLATTSPVQCGGPVSISGSFTSCRWAGSAPFINYSTASLGNIDFINVYGGYLGTASEPVMLPSGQTETNDSYIFNTFKRNSAYNFYDPTYTGWQYNSISYGVTGTPLAQQGYVFNYKTPGSNSATSAYIFWGDGTAQKTGGGSWSAISDSRLKDNVQPLSGALAKITALQPVTYNWKIDAVGEPTVGFVAQDVEKVIPSAVGKHSPTEAEKELVDDMTYSIGWKNDMFAYLVGAIKELSAKVDELSAK